MENNNSNEKSRDYFYTVMYPKLLEKFDIIKGYEKSDIPLVLKCRKCGEIFNFGYSYCKKLIKDNKLPNCPKCEYGLVLSKLSRFSRECAINKIESLFPRKFCFDLFEYNGDKKKSIFICNDCGNLFIKTPFNLKQDGKKQLYDPCPICNMRKIKEHHRAVAVINWVKESKKVHGDGEYNYYLAMIEYKNIITPVHIYDNRLKEYFLQRPIDHSTKGHGNPNRSNSKGEQFVRTWLDFNSIVDFLYDKPLIGEIIGKNSNLVRIDYRFKFKNKEIWIEVNGKQHYEEVYRFHQYCSLEKQLQRDQNVRDYCRRNNILLIEIPYTLDTYEKVKEFLDKVILQGIDSNTLIDYKSLYKIN